MRSHITNGFPIMSYLRFRVVNMHLLFSLSIVIIAALYVTTSSWVVRFRFNMDALCVAEASIFADSKVNCEFHLEEYFSHDDLRIQSLRLATLLALNPYHKPVAEEISEISVEVDELDIVTGSRFLLVQHLNEVPSINLTKWRGIASSNLLETIGTQLQISGMTREAGSSSELAYRLDSGWYDQWQRGINARTHARQYLELGQWDESRDAYVRAIESFAQADHPLTDEYTCYAYFRLGEIAEARGNIDQAIEYYTQGIWASPQHSDFSRPVNLLLGENSSLTDIDHYLAYVRHNGPQDNAFLWSYSATILDQLGAQEMALQVINETTEALQGTPTIRDIFAKLTEPEGD